MTEGLLDIFASSGHGEAIWRKGFQYTQWVLALPFVFIYKAHRVFELCVQAMNNLRNHVFRN